ncbi:MAG TPA: type II toxin-antitoxin system RelE/ParE family toxin [Candidatus Brocadiales bacterium]|nr:type II toxin-antitoxin system RelE/ParE family toxin [Candidatus Brocadiales bacterium]
MYKAILHKDAIKFYKRADTNLRKRINSAIEVIVQNPPYHIHIKKLQGDLSNMYRYRLGDIRILYEIHEDIGVVRIKTIEQRGSAYK